jgi:7,8-dihydropterin-6-yl-methyl-4-(beta-D-ribofuranosyl)aminobenzene 5'-phosphate synthase
VTAPPGVSAAEIVTLTPSTPPEKAAPKTPTPPLATATSTQPVRNHAQNQPTSPVVATRIVEQPSTSAITQTITQAITLTILYDNHPGDPQLASAWGFSALIDYGDHSVLFDSGGDGQILLANMRVLGIDPQKIESVVLSHAHDDHTGGMIPLLSTGIKPVVFLLPSFPSSFKRQVEQFTQVIEVLPGQSIAEGIWTTGEIRGEVAEQALVIQTKSGLVVITGCAHPGIISILENVHQMSDEPIRLVLGGFHLGDKSEAEIDRIVSDFRRLSVRQVAPCHCTGETAIVRFADEYGSDHYPLVVGSMVHMEP